ncbi:MAG: hypothetical protein WBX25_37015 [Rhodomicrobium sp.]
MGISQTEAQGWTGQIFEKRIKAQIKRLVYVPDAGHARLIERH